MQVLSITYTDSRGIKHIIKVPTLLLLPGAERCFTGKKSLHGYPGPRMGGGCVCVVQGTQSGWALSPQGFGK
jgi:hypothetical protein